ncbi:MAG: zinc carboxypeptidase [Ferruginibacter sp.]|nr:zinc carboxypeptidase [Cytophagales bacterium]
MKKKLPLVAALGGILLFQALTAFSQTNLPTPEAFLGYPLGSRVTPHHRVAAYVEHAASQAPTRCKIQRYGTTNEGRPLMIAIVSSEENIRRLEEIRTNNLKRTGLLAGTPTASPIALVWLSHSVHGNEASGTEASMATLHALLDPGRADVQGWLKNTVVILDPSLNPDGRDRFAGHVNQTGTVLPSATTDAREHREPWPGGRYNHYLYDLNRDWAWFTQKETQGRVALYHQWMPHIHADLHEQGANSPYYFAPAAEPLHERITPWQREFQTTIGKNHARYFDQNGWLYFTKERFDLFYPSYGDTWPTYNGAIGMTYEQASVRGLSVVLADGDTLTYGEAIAHHHVTSLSTVEIASQNAGKLVAEFEKFFDKARHNPDSRYKSFVIKGDNEAGKLAHLLALLDRNQIAYGRAAAARKVTGFNYARGKDEPSAVGSGDIVVSAYQPKSVLAEILFEPRSALSDSSTYDITAWSLPYAYSLDAFATPERIAADGKTPAPAPTPAAGDRPYAYLVPWTNLNSVQYLGALLQKKVRVRYAELPFEVNNRKYDRGTLVITRAANEGLGGRFDQIVREEAAKINLTLEATATGFVSNGKDFGSGFVRPIRTPTVALLSGRGTSPTAFGEVWYYFEQEIRFPLTLLDTEYFAAVDLSPYDVLIVPNVSASGNPLNEAALTKLRAWVKEGGKLILLENAIGGVMDKEGFAVKKYESETARKAAEEREEKEKLKNRLTVYGDRERNSLSADVPGAIFRVNLDNTHPLAFGYTSTYYTLKQSSTGYAYFGDAWNVGVIRKGNYVAGFVGSKVKSRPDETTVFGVQESGRGQVIYLVDDPLFRSFWYGGKLLFGNAVFLVGQ